MNEMSPLSTAPLTATPLSAAELGLFNRWWHAANYLSVGQIYLLANPLLREPLKLEHTKPRLLGHWGTTPGLNFLYLHLNRIIARGTPTSSSSPVPGMARRASWPIRTSKARTANISPRCRRTKTGWADC